jgi:hypothetical protein
MITMVSVRLTHETVLKSQNRTGIFQTVCIASHRIRESMGVLGPEHAFYHMNQSCVFRGHTCKIYRLCAHQKPYNYLSIPYIQYQHYLINVWLPVLFLRLSLHLHYFSTYMINWIVEWVYSIDAKSMYYNVYIWYIIWKLSWRVYAIMFLPLRLHAI